MAQRTVVLEGGAPWGFRLQGGKEFGEPIRIAKINPNSKAYVQGIESGDLVESINGNNTQGLKHHDALQLIRNASDQLILNIRKADFKLGAQANGPKANGDINRNTSQYINGEESYAKYSSIPSITVTDPSEEEMYSTESPHSVVGGGQQHAPPPSSTNPVSPHGGEAMEVEQGGRATPSTTVWSPFGGAQKKLYKPVSFKPSSQPTAGTPASGPVPFQPSPQQGHQIPVDHSFRDTSFASASSSGVSSMTSYNGTAAQQHGHPASSSASAMLNSTMDSGHDSQSTESETAERVQELTQITDQIECDQAEDEDIDAQAPKHMTSSATISLSTYSTDSGNSESQSEMPFSEALPPGGTVDLEDMDWESMEEEESQDFSYWSPWPRKPPKPRPPKRDTKPDNQPQKSVLQLQQSPTLTAKRSHELVGRKITSLKVGGSTPVNHTQVVGDLRVEYLPTHDPPAEPYQEQEAEHSEEEDSVDYVEWTPPSQKSVLRLPQSPTLTARRGHSQGARKIMNLKVQDITAKQNPYIDVKTGQFTDQSVEDFHLANTVGSPPPLALTQNGEASDSPRLSSTNTFSTGPKTGVWTPGSDQRTTAEEIRREIEQEREKERQREAASQDLGLWSPPAPSSPTKKQFTPMEPSRFSGADRTNQEGRPLSPPESSTAITSIAATSGVTTTVTTSMPSTTGPSSSSWNGTISHFSETKSGLPTSQSPMITLLQKNRENDDQDFDIPTGVKTVMVDEGQIPRGAVYVGTKESFEGDRKHTDSYYVFPGENGENTTTETKTTILKAPRYQGIGPTDDSTGMPVALRSSVSDNKQKDWYKKMYKTLHKTEKSPGPIKKQSGIFGTGAGQFWKNEEKEINTYKPTYVFPEDDSEPEKEAESEGDPQPSKQQKTLSLDRQSSSPIKSRSSWSPPHAKYRLEEYKNQPLSITEYEPGCSSLALKESRTLDEEDTNTDTQSNAYNPPIEKPGQYSKYTESQSDTEIRRKEGSLSPGSERSRHAYKQVQLGGDIPAHGLGYPAPIKKERQWSAQQQQQEKHRSLSEYPTYGRSPTGSMDRKQRDEENARRRAQMRRQQFQLEKIYAEEKRRRMIEEQAQNEARRHSDFWTPKQKSPIPLNRFDLDADDTSIPRPKKKVGTTIRGKARALYTFKAQNPKELSFRKNDTLYLLREIDQNWYEGEHHGTVGIFPRNYVEVLTSLEAARQAAFSREGIAYVKHNFNAHTNVELTLRKGDEIQLVRRVDENWYEGRIDNRQGIFPVSYVEINREPDTPLLTPMSSYAPTPAGGSPSLLSPVSTVSTNGPAPTIPDAPLSPTRSLDFPYFNYPSSSQSGSRPASQHSMNSYPRGGDSYSSPGSARKGGYEGALMPYQEPGKSPSSERRYGYPRRDEFDTSMNSYRQNGSMGGGYTAPSAQRKEPDSQQYRVSLGEEPQYPTYKAVYTYMPQNEDELELQEGDIVYVMERCDDGWYVGTSHRTKEFGTFPGNYVQPYAG